MKKLLSIFIVFGIILTSCEQPEEVSLERKSLLQTLNEEVTGDLAYETTAYVEQFWREVGNSGFDSSIYFVARKLDSLGFVKEEKATSSDRLTYRIEKRPLEEHTWEPTDASLRIVGEDSPLLEFKTNRNMIAMYSHSTTKDGLVGEVVHIEDVQKLGETDVFGKIVYAESNPYRIYKTALDNGALGLITYNNPEYLQPKKNKTSIQFRRIPNNPDLSSWAIALSYEANERLKQRLNEGAVEVNVNIQTKIYKSEELTVVADVKGSVNENERFVFSAHVQEPGANDNASGVGAALEMAAVTARMVKDGRLSPKRTITFLWGDEIVSTGRYIQEDSIRAQDIKWGISLDMVGENTAVTGGSFLIEKMPDPSAIWTRGKDEHTEWGATEMTLDDMKPHYLNDYVWNTFKVQGELAGWNVKTNPFEGGSDHVPFLRADIPGVLLWHFTDQFYHTDNDRLDKVSKVTLKNVSVGALTIAYNLVNSNINTAKSILTEMETAAMLRLDDELMESKHAIAAGDSLEVQFQIIDAWADWYEKAAYTTIDLVPSGETAELNVLIEATNEKIRQKVDEIKGELGNQM